MSRYLLIVACSQRKRPDPGLLPAIERYDGVNYRVLRKAQRDGYWPNNLDVLILSAKFGLIRLDTPIENYNLRMTRERAMELQNKVGTDLDAQFRKNSYTAVYVNLGKEYLAALASSQGLPKLSSQTRYASGGIGKRMAQMKSWLIGISRISE